jgi:hypothetical protein
MIERKVYLLNKIEIGQFLYMKYKVIGQNMTRKKITEKSGSLRSGHNVSIIKPIITKKAKVVRMDIIKV